MEHPCDVEDRNGSPDPLYVSVSKFNPSSPGPPFVTNDRHRRLAAPPAAVRHITGDWPVATGFGTVTGALVLLNSLSMMIQLEMEGRTIASQLGAANLASEVLELGVRRAAPWVGPVPERSDEIRWSWFCKLNIGSLLHPPSSQHGISHRTREIEIVVIIYIYNIYI